jgi:AcrR family transcriptional regulator
MSRPGEEVAKRLGRPRDPDIEDRVYDAAMEIYSQLGWPGFTFEAITKATGIGKAAVYRRWSSRGQLLAETFEHRWLTVDEIDSGSLREDLIQLVAMFLDRMTGRYGMAFVHMWIDRVNYPEAQDATATYRTQMVTAGRQIVRRAVRRGELPSGTSPTLIIDLVVGGIQNHVISTPPHLRPQMEARMYAFGEELVDTVLRGALSSSARPSGSDRAHA